MKRNKPGLMPSEVFPEINPRDNSYELDAGEVVYFDRFLNEWVPVLEVR